MENKYLQNCLDGQSILYNHQEIHTQSAQCQRKSRYQWDLSIRVCVCVSGMGVESSVLVNTNDKIHVEKNIAMNV